MMGRENPPQPDLFYTRFNLERRVRPDHPLRAVAAKIDFGFLYNEVEHCYGPVGNVSVPPPMILKLMLLLTYYNVRSERELMATLPERLDWLWFLGLDLDSPVPDHSVLSKARARWGVEAFRRFFERVVERCHEQGLIDGSKIFCDSSLIDANASEKSVIRRAFTLREVTDEMERRLDHAEPSRAYSATDPDASVVGKRGTRPRPRYKTHRAIDSAHGVLTATALTPGAVNEGHQLSELIDQHERVVGRAPEVVVADSQYGTTENYLKCQERGIQPHIPPLAEVNNQARLRHEGKFTSKQFVYDQPTDTYTCPAGRTLRRVGIRKQEKVIVYAARSADCQQCPLRSQCTNSTRRKIRRHVQQAVLDKIGAQARSVKAKADLKRRQHFLEGSFAQATRYGFKRARWRGLWRVQIQDLLIAAIQNIVKIIENRPPKRLAQAATASGAIGTIQKVLNCAHERLTRVAITVSALLRNLLGSSLSPVPTWRVS